MNKYQSTSRILVLAFQILIFLAFGAFGCYYGFFCVPFVSKLAGITFDWVNTTTAFNLSYELAVIGLTGMTTAIYGIYQGVKGIMEPTNDDPVVKGLTTFIVQGYLAAAFFFLNAAVFFDLVKGTNLAFVIVIASILFILLMIATNIPMVRLYDNRDQKPLLASLSYGFAVAAAWVFLINAIALISTYTHAAEAFYGEIRSFLFTGVVTGLASALFLFFAGYLITKGDKTKESALLTSGSILSAGLYFLVYGILSFVWRDDNCHLNYVDMLSKNAKAAGYGFPIMCLILGSLLILGALAFALISTDEDIKGKITGKKA